MRAAAFYTGLVAELYAPLRGHVYDDPAPWRDFILDAGEPALELGCGDGDPLLALRQEGLDVEGVDSSQDMLDRCRAAAARRGLTVVLHHQAMERLQLERRYRSIFLAGPTFNLLPDDAAARRALASIRAHLRPDGQALVPLFRPSPTPPEDLGRAREHRADDGACLRVTPVAERHDTATRTRTTLLRYERVSPAGTAERLERPWVIHWYDPAGFCHLAAEAGLVVTDTRGPDQDDPAGGWQVRLRRRHRS